MSIDPNIDFQGFLREEVAAQVAAARTGGAAADTHQPEPLDLTIGGTKYTYGSKAELESAMNNFVGAVSTKMQDLESKANAPVQPAEGSFVTGNEAQDPFDEKEFVERMTKSPKDGLDYWLNQRVFDGKSEDPVADIKRNMTETELTKRTIAAYQFKENHAEFPGGPQAAQVIEKFRQDLNLPYDYNGIEAAYLMAINRGALPNYPQLAAQQQWQQQQAQQQNLNQGYGYEQANAFRPQDSPNPYLNAPPGVNRNNPSFGPGVDLESLSIEQLEALAQKANMFRR